jgi:hypothetical protein
MTTTGLHTGKLPPRLLSAIKRRAAALGLTPAEYLQQLIEEDLAIGAKAKTTSLDLSEDDALTSELLQGDPAFRALVAKSKASPRKPFRTKRG